MNINDDQDVDMLFFVTAHEIAHQWWGMQLEAANVQGQNMILETLSQYSALMAFKQKYSDEKVQQLLKYQLDKYTEGKTRSENEEIPLATVDDQGHIYYNKGALIMHKLQEAIGEGNINLALQNFLRDWRSDNPKRPDHYATTRELLHYFRDVTPDSTQYLIADLFEKVYDLD